METGRSRFRIIGPIGTGGADAKPGTRLRGRHSYPPARASVPALQHGISARRIFAIRTAGSMRPATPRVNHIPEAAISM